MITNKHLGALLVIIGILAIILTSSAKTKEDYYIEALVESHGGACVLEDGYCLHNDRNWTGYIAGFSIGIGSVLLGIYLLFFEKSYDMFKRQQESFAREVKKAKQKDEFAAYLAGFNDEEKMILKAIHDQEGIKQSTLRYRTGITKSSLSLILNSLENREVISRRKSGKTKEVYLRKKF